MVTNHKNISLYWITREQINNGDEETMFTNALIAELSGEVDETLWHLAVQRAKISARDKIEKRRKERSIL